MVRTFIRNRAFELRIGPERLTALAAALLLVPLLALAVPHTARAQQHGGHGGHGADSLGVVDFGVSCDASVQPDFDRAVALLHHMMYQEARSAFEEIATEAPGCAMAHWGIAMTLFQPLWPARPGADVMRRGHEAVERAKALEPGTDRERDLLAAAAAFYREPESADWWTRIRRWTEAMEKAHAERPEDIETGAFWALAQLAVAPVAEDGMERRERAARELLAIHERESEHPGAIHYTIHANDVAGRAGESLDVVRSYDEIAPSVPHALHMPTHILVRLGEWPGVIEWNRRSADAAFRLPADDGVSLHYVHALDYLTYAHLQRAEDRRAREVLEEALEKERYQEDFATAFHLSAMPARYAVERRAWDEAAAITPRTPGYLAWDRYPWAEGLSWLARGLGRLHTGDLSGARAAADRLRELRDQAREAGESGFATYIEVDRLILDGWLAHAEGRPEQAVERLREAADLEKTVEKHPISPGALLPPDEALGDLLLELDRPEEALEAYRKSLGTWPARYDSLVGAARAARAAGLEDEAREHYGRLLDVVGDEARRPGVDEARSFLGGG